MPEVKTKEEIQREIELKGQDLAILKDKIKNGARALGIEPKMSVVTAELEKAETELKKAEAEIDKALKELESIEIMTVEDAQVEPEDEPVDEPVEETIESKETAAEPATRIPPGEIPIVVSAKEEFE